MSDDQLLSVRESVEYLNTLSRARKLIERTFLNAVDRGELEPDIVRFDGSRPRRYFQRATLDAWSKQREGKTDEV